MNWQPNLGASCLGWGTRFRVWAPAAQAVEVVLEAGAGQAAHPLAESGGGFFSATLPGVAEGALYRYRVDGKGPFPDPASRYQPHGVHGPSQVVDPARFEWTDSQWTTKRTSGRSRRKGLSRRPRGACAGSRNSESPPSN